jgi:two-component system, OmpR family, sensor kinase
MTVPTLTTMRTGAATAISARLRILAVWVPIIALALAGSIVVTREVLLARVDERIANEFTQKVQELRAFAREGLNPETGRPWSRVEQLLALNLSRDIPDDNETMLAFVDGRPYRRSAQPPPARLDTDRRFVSAVSEIRHPATGMVQTAAGAVRYAAVPVSLRGQPQRAVYAIAIFRDRERADVNQVVGVLAVVGAGALLLAALACWGLAGRLLAPIRVLTATARSIGESDLTRRIPVEGTDEISRLAATFNAMLDRLEAAFSSQRAFVSDAGHELRTPITIIRGHLELLGDDPQERRETLALVGDELDRMGRFVEDLLTLAKAERPDFLYPEDVDIDELAEELVAKASALAPRRWELERVVPGRIVADRQRLTQAVMNLAHNAVDHTDVGGRIGLGCSLVNGHARLWVHDSGPGVAPEDAERIFERFARAGDAPRRTEGAGLGLAIVRAIADAHGGRVELDSAPGDGAAFTIVIPIEPPRVENT